MKLLFPLVLALALPLSLGAQEADPVAKPRKKDAKVAAKPSATPSRSLREVLEGSTRPKSIIPETGLARPIKFRPQLALREWRGPGTYDGRYWKERPRYQYDGVWHFYGTGPLPRYDDFSNTQPVYDESYTDAVDGRPSAAPAVDRPSPVAAAQKALKEKGHYAGEISGRFDAASQRAVRAFQEASSLPVTGELDPATLGKLGL